jgi:L-seryl-tRNA(Ser) seleniumtransferase
MSDQPRPPSIERLLRTVRPRVGERDPDALLAAAREIADRERSRLDIGMTPATLDGLATELMARLDDHADPRRAGPTPVINATGVLIHTNLGRVPWPRAAIEAAERAAAGSSMLELDPATGRRGPRFRAAEDHLVALTGAEDALVVNNNAAALALAVGLADRRGVAVSRGELIEIGGGVRIPEVVRRAGARLVEVGTTNRTRLADFEAVLAEGRAALVLRVHPSNFTQEGFVETPDPTALAALAHRHLAIVVDDLGSGALIDTARFGLAHEPMPGERLAAGADLVTFSGDKLLGGPQAGLIVGRRDLIGRLRKDPLARAMRPDKVTLAAVAATLGLYRSGLALREIPLWRAIAADEASLRYRATRLAALGGQHGEVVATRATIGGGSLPGETLPSAGVAITGPRPQALLDRLRTGDPAVIARIEHGTTILDLRSVDPADDERLASALARALIGAPGLR